MCIRDSVGILYGLLLILAIAFLRFGAPLVVDQAANISAQLSEDVYKRQAYSDS